MNIDFKSQSNSKVFVSEPEYSFAGGAVGGALGAAYVSSAFSASSSAATAAISAASLASGILTGLYLKGSAPAPKTGSGDFDADFAAFKEAFCKVNHGVFTLSGITALVASATSTAALFALSHFYNGASAASTPWPWSR